MRFFPLFMDLDDQSVLLVGGGEPAAQKLRLLTRTGARIHVLATAPCSEIVELAAAGAVRLERRELAARDLAGVRLAYVALADHAASARAVAMARAAGVPVNAVDRQELCDFITPAIVDRDPVIVAIGTEGAAPVLARQIKARIEAMLPSRLGGLARWAGSLRQRAAGAISTGAARRRFWEEFFAGSVAQAYLAGDLPGATNGVERALAGVVAGTGRVSLVGAGPGDPDLLTIKAMRALQEADVIVADRLIGSAILDRARREARRIMVGNSPGHPSPSQAEINAILLREVAAGHHVVRLKAGDLSMLGHDGEELAAWRTAGVSVEIVPGVSAATDCATTTGPALTKRDWIALARPGQTLGTAPAARRPRQGRSTIEERVT